MLAPLGGALGKSVGPAFVKWEEDVCALIKGHTVSDTLWESYKAANELLKNSQGLLKIL